MKAFTGRGPLAPGTSTWQRLLASRWLRILTGVALSTLSLYLALREISLQGVSQALSGAKWSYLGAAMGCLVVHHWAKAVRWQILLAQTRPITLVDARFLKVLLALLAGQMLNLVYPARVGDISRAIMVGNDAAGKASAGGTIILEKALDTIIYVGLIIVLAGLVTLPGWLAGPLWGVAGLLLILLSLLYLLVFRPSWLRWAEQRLVSWISRRAHLETLDQFRIESMLGSFHAGMAGYTGLSSLSTSLPLASWSLLTWGMSILINIFVILALNLPMQNPTMVLSAALLVLVGLQAGISVPAIPGRVGIFEYICILALSVFGISATAAFSYGVLLHILVMLPLLITGLASLSFLGLSRVSLQADQFSEEIGAPQQNAESDPCKP